REELREGLLAGHVEGVLRPLQQYRDAQRPCRAMRQRAVEAQLARPMQHQALLFRRYAAPSIEHAVDRGGRYPRRQRDLLGICLGPHGDRSAPSRLLVALRATKAMIEKR